AGGRRALARPLPQAARRRHEPDPAGTAAPRGPEQARMNTATFSLATMAPAIPEIVLALLVFGAFLREEDRHVTYWLAVVSLVGTAALAAGTIGRPTVVTFQGMFVADL